MNEASFYLSQTEQGPLSHFRAMRDVQASMKKTLETNSVRGAKSLQITQARLMTHKLGQKRSNKSF